MGEAAHGGLGVDLDIAGRDVNRAERDFQSFEGVGSVENHRVEGNSYQTTNIFHGASGGAVEEKKALGDVLKPLEDRSRGCEARDLSRMRPQWSPDKIGAALLVSCDDHEMALAAARAWITQDYTTRERLCVHLSREPGLGLEFLDELAQGLTEPSVILVEVSGSHRFLNALLDSEVTRLESVLNGLEGMSVTLVLAVATKVLHASGYDPTKPPPFQHVEVDWLWQLLFGHFEPKRAAELETRLEDQRRLGKWPKALDELCDEISRLLATSPATLEEAIAQKEGSANQGAEVRDLLPTEVGLEHYAVAVAVLFARLPFPIFEKVLLQVVGGVSIRDESESFVLRDGVALSTRDENRRELSELWAEDSDGVLQRCGLENAPNEERGIRLARAGIRQDLREYLMRSHPRIFGSVIGKLTDPTFLLGVDLPRGFLADLVTLVIEEDTAALAPLGPGWLDEALAAAVSSLPPKRRSPRAADDYLLRRSSLEVASVDPWLTVPRRLARILETLVTHEARHGMVEGWLRRVVEKPLPAESGSMAEESPEDLDVPPEPAPLDPRSVEDALLLEVVLELCRAGQFGWLPWLRPWADRGDSEIKGDLERILLAWALDSRTRAWDVLGPISSWLPGIRASDAEVGSEEAEGVEEETWVSPTGAEAPDGEELLEPARGDANETQGTGSEKQESDSGAIESQASEEERAPDLGSDPAAEDAAAVTDGEPGSSGREGLLPEAVSSTEKSPAAGPRVTEPGFESSRGGVAHRVASALLGAASEDAEDYCFVARRRRCPLFRDLRFDPSSDKTRHSLERLVHWLVWVQALQDHLDPQADVGTRYRKVSEALLTWCFVLEGVDPDPKGKTSEPKVPTEISPVLEHLLEIVARRFQPWHKQGLLDYWHLKCDAFLRLSRTPRFRDRRRVTSQLRRKTRELRRRFKSIDRAQRRAAKSPRRRRPA